jgi:hypothetical protein
MYTKWPLSWKISLNRMGWWQFALCIGLMGLWLLLTQAEWAQQNYLVTAVRTAEILIPLFAGIHAAYVFSPDDERPLELLLVAPRPIFWLIAERFLLLLVVYATIGLAAILLIYNTFDIGSATISDMLIHWLPPTVWFMGVGFYLTMVTRQGSFGTLMVIVIWGTSLISSGGVPQKYIAIAPILPYLRRGAANITDNIYTLNRITLIASGLLLLGLALRLALDEERLLGIKKGGLGTRDWRLRQLQSP